MGRLPRYDLGLSALLHLEPSTEHRRQVYGRRPVMLASVGLFALGGAISGSAQSMNMLIAGRGTCSIALC